MRRRTRTLPRLRSLDPALRAPPDDQVQQAAPIVAESGQYQKGLATFTTTINYVVVPVTILDKKHQQVSGLNWRDFRLYENNQRQRIAFFSADAVPLSVALVIDQSLTRDVMKKVNDSLSAIQGGFTASDEIAVFTYADGVNNPTDFTAALSARVPARAAGLQEGRRVPRCSDHWWSPGRWPDH